MVPQHGDARQPLDAHDDLEGALVSHACAFASASFFFKTVELIRRRLRSQSKLATIRNANSEDEIDDSMLQLGLLAYPVLQAADVLLYKCVASPLPLRLAHAQGPLTLLASLCTQDLARPRRTRPVSAPRARARPRTGVQPRVPGATKRRQGQGQRGVPRAGGHAQCVSRLACRPEPATLVVAQIAHVPGPLLRNAQPPIRESSPFATRRRR